MKSEKVKTMILFAALFALFFALMFDPNMRLRRKLGSDDSSYLSHAFTIGLDGDLDYSNEPVIAGLKDTNLPKHSVGSGILAAPFVAFFSILDRASNHPVIQKHEEFFGSWSFFGFDVAANVYFLAGVFFYLCIFRSLYSSSRPWIVYLLCISTGVPHFVLMRFTMSHSFEFFAGAFLLLAIIRLYENFIQKNKTSFFWLCSCTAALAISLYVRRTNYNLLLIVHLTLLMLYTFKCPQYDNVQKQRFRKCFLCAFPVVLLGWIPLILYNCHYFGRIFPSAVDLWGTDLYGMSSTPVTEILFQLLRRIPQIILILFSSEWGVIYTNPILVFGICFLVLFLVRVLLRDKKLFHLITLLLLLLFVGFNVAIILMAGNTGMCYGYRHLFPLIPVGMLGTILLLNKIDNEFSKKVAGRSIYIAIIALGFISTISMLFYGASDKLWAKRQINVFGVMQNSSGKGYMLDLPTEVIKPGTWKNILSRRYLGFITKRLAICFDTSQAHNDKHDKILDTPLNIYIQATILLFLWSTAGCLYGLKVYSIFQRGLGNTRN